MELTKEHKEYIDSLTYDQMLAHWRFAAVGDDMFQGATGEYWSKRMFALRDADPDAAVRASKIIGWER